MKHLVVIGGGVIGLCAAYYAKKSGWEVTVLEQNSVGFAGTSHGNAGMIVPSHFVPLASPGMLRMGLKLMFDLSGPLGFSGLHRPAMWSWLYAYVRHANQKNVRRYQHEILESNLASRDAYRELALELGDFGLTERGLLMICRNAATLAEEGHVAEAARNLGLRASVLSCDEVQALNPGCEVRCAGAVHFLDDAWLAPPLFLGALRRQLGEAIRYDSPVREILPDTVNGIPYDRLVIAAGSESAPLARQVGVRLNLQPGKGYGYTVPLQEDSPGVCGILVEARVAFSPTAAGVRFTSGMIIGDASCRLDERRVGRFQSSVADYMPSFPAARFSGLEPWVGFRPCVPSGVPIVRRVSEKVILATGHGMMGMSLGPVTGKRVAELLG